MSLCHKAVCGVCKQGVGIGGSVIHVVLVFTGGALHISADCGSGDIAAPETRITNPGPTSIQPAKFLYHGGFDGPINQPWERLNSAVEHDNNELKNVVADSIKRGDFKNLKALKDYDAGRIADYVAKFRNSGGSAQQASQLESRLQDTAAEIESKLQEFLSLPAWQRSLEESAQKAKDHVYSTIDDNTKKFLDIIHGQPETYDSANDILVQWNAVVKASLG
jgi:hypothetical protein